MGDGWKVAVTTLMNERVAIGGGVTRRGEGLIESVMDEYRRDPAAQATRDRVMELWVRAEVLRLTTIRSATGLAKGTPGPEGSIGKLARTELMQDLYRCHVDMMGMEGASIPRDIHAPTRTTRRAEPILNRRSCGAGPSPSRAARRRS